MTDVVRRMAVRHRAAPEVNGCRWCGYPERWHAQQWVPSRKWHRWERPTDQQRKARMWGRRVARLRDLGELRRVNAGLNFVRGYGPPWLP